MDKKDKTIIPTFTQEEIDNYNSIIGNRKARKKRYGLSSNQRIKRKKDN